MDIPMMTRYKKPKKVDFKTLLLYNVISCNISKMSNSIT